MTSRILHRLGRHRATTGVSAVGVLVAVLIISACSDSLAPSIDTGDDLTARAVLAEARCRATIASVRSALSLLEQNTGPSANVSASSYDEDFEPIEDDEPTGYEFPDDGFCWEQYMKLIKACKKLPKKVDRAICYAAAMNWYADCLFPPPPCGGQTSIAGIIVPGLSLAVGGGDDPCPGGGGGGGVGGGGGGGGDTPVRCNCQQWHWYEDGRLMYSWWECSSGTVEQCVPPLLQ